jgi:uncharacterized protein YdeI (YjbR/CyaY-like superfamily)
MDPKIDLFLAPLRQWNAEMTALRQIALGCDLHESLKWGKPCYDWKGRNILILQNFKTYCAVLFFNGYLLEDPDHILVKTGNNTLVGRQVRFKSKREIDELAVILAKYIQAACLIDEEKIKAQPKPQAKLSLPVEFERILDEDKVLREAFHALTPGRQRGYAIYFGQAKQAATREARIGRWLKAILQGKGLND